MARQYTKLVVKETNVMHVKTHSPRKMAALRTKEGININTMDAADGALRDIGKKVETSGSFIHQF